jgi:glycosyltransferase involved in cell wall biosynthesis
MFVYSSPRWSGSARVFVAAARGLAARGYHVTLVCPERSSVEEHAAAEGCDVVAMDLGGRPLAVGWRLRRLLASRFIETVFVHTESEHLAASVAIRLAGRGGVVRRVPAGVKPVIGSATRLALTLATGGFVFTTEAEARAERVLRRARPPAVAELGVDSAVYEQLRGVSLNTLGATVPRARLVVCVLDRDQNAEAHRGRTPDAQGGAAQVLRAVALLASRHPELHVAILGEESAQEKLRMHAAALGITDRVRALGARDDDLAVLRAAHIGWVVAESDSAAFAAIDFMAMRIPVLVDRGTVGARYIADGITGVALSPGDPTSAASALAGLLAQDKQRAAMGQAGRVRVARDYSEAAMLDALQACADIARDRSRWKA